MTRSVETQLLDALELFQYSYRFRHSLFVLMLHPEVALSDILGDLKLLQSSHISLMLVCRNFSGLKESLDKLTERGLPFWFLAASSTSPISDTAQEQTRLQLKQDAIPVLAFAEAAGQPAASLCAHAVAVAAAYDADRLFYISKERGVLLDGVMQSHLAPDEVAGILEDRDELNLDPELLKQLHQANKEHGFEIAILDGTPGSLFQEIFTHKGRGTLLTDDYPNVIRRGKLSDVFAVSRLLRPYIENGTILPVTEDEIAEHIASYYVYTVNDALVAAAQLIDYGNACALSKFCTLPRYQGKGRARQLAKKMISTARRRGKEYVFALSISPPMWTFFTKLGFSEVPRESLPGEWRKDYDFARPSKAFALKFPRKSESRDA